MSTGTRVPAGVLLPDSKIGCGYPWEHEHYVTLTLRSIVELLVAGTGGVDIMDKLRCPEGCVVTAYWNNNFI